MEKILGLDLGTNSIGWAIRDTTLTKNQIEKFGVITFKKGVGLGKTGEYSYAAERTSKRSARRLYQARKYRKWATLEVLINEGYCPLTKEDLDKWRKYDKEEAVKNNNAGRVYPIWNFAFDQWIKLDFNGDDKPDYSSPYQLRKELAESKLDLTVQENRYKLGRSLYHIAQRRGFKSSRKANDKENEVISEETMETVDISQPYSEKKKNKNINELYEKYPKAKTIGWLFANLEKDDIRIRNDIAQYAIRDNYKDEIKYIFEIQGLDETHVLFRKLVESGKNKNDGSIFYKRPLRSQKGLIGRCTMDSSKYRSPINHPKFEFFRAWSFLNNIKYKDGNNEYIPLSIELKHKLYNELFINRLKAYFLFSDIEKFVNREFGRVLKYNYKSKTSVSSCPVSSRLCKIFGEDFMNVKIPKKIISKMGKDYYDIEDIWHVLFTYEDHEFVKEFAEQKLNLNEEESRHYLIAWNGLPVGYGMLSINAITKINYFLKKGLIYTEAVLLANIPTILGENLWKENEFLFLDSISEIIERNRLKKTIVSITNSLIAKHKNLKSYEQFGSDEYKLDDDDIKHIHKAIRQTIGERKWQSYSEKDQEIILQAIKICYQSYFVTSDLVRKDINGERYFIIMAEDDNYYKSDSGFYKIPRLIDTLADFLASNFDLSEKQLSKIYHPSQINIYPPAKEIDGILKLGSPKTGSFKNPMAMRTLHELRKLINYLIDIRAIDTDTKVVVEVARDLNDANKRWAIETWQRQREAENQEFAKVIEDLLKEDRSIKADFSKKEDIDKLRLFCEQDLEQYLPPVVISDDKNTKGNKNRKRAKTDEIVRWKGLGGDLIKKYRLWKEQGYQCMYTGKIITLTDLFNDNVIDFEHTIPRSQSFDNSLANMTVCYADFNRTIKKNQLPKTLENYDKIYNYGGKIGECSPIISRLKHWEDKVERIRQQIEFWKTKSKNATDMDWKNDAIRQRHLWQMELNYWSNKVNRFKMDEITSGFINSQLVDTQLISKYSFHYLKSYFDKVSVQKGRITAEFRKIYSLQPSDEEKDRDKHSHHAKDAAVLTLIPHSAERERILKEWYLSMENNKINFSERKPYAKFKREYVFKIDDSILINNVSRDQSLTTAKRKIRKRGKEVIINGRNRWATGDSVRGQLHQETFYGAIRPAKRGEKGNIKRNEEGKIIQDDLKYVVRVPFDANFIDVDIIVDEGLKNQIKEQVVQAGSFKKAYESGIYLLDKKGKPHGNKIRHIRVWAHVSQPLKIKKHTYPSDKEYKQYYYATNGENKFCAFYQKVVIDKKTKKEKFDRSIEILSLKDVSDLMKNGELKNEDDLKRILFKKDKNDDSILHNSKKELPYAILKPDMKVIFYENEMEELKQEEDESDLEYKKRISYQMYKIVKFTGGRLTFLHHLEARNDNALKEAYPKEQVFKISEKGVEVKYGGRGTNGFTELINDAKKYNKYNGFEPWPKLLYSASWLSIAIENEHFEVKPDGKIEWKI